MIQFSAPTRQVRQTKAVIKADLQSIIDAAHKDCLVRIDAMKEQSHNPQVAAMIQKNQGYIAALQDVTELLYSRKVF